MPSGETHWKAASPESLRLSLQSQWYEQLLAGARLSLDKEGNPNAWHGGLLALRCLVGKVNARRGV